MRCGRPRPPVASEGAITFFLFVIGALVVIIAVPGLLISLYVTLVTYRIMLPDARWVPRFCRMGEDTCRSVLDHPDSRVAGIPNSVPGLVYYCVVCIAAVAGFPAPLRLPLLVSAWAAVALGLYLTYSLIFRVRVACRLCLASHAVNLALALLLTLGPV